MEIERSRRVVIDNLVDNRWGGPETPPPKPIVSGAGLVYTGIFFPPALLPRRTGFDARRGCSRIFRMRKSWRTMPLVCGFSRGSLVYPALFFPGLLRTHLATPSSALVSSILRAAQIKQQIIAVHLPLRARNSFSQFLTKVRRGRGGVVVRLLASNQGDTGLDSRWGPSWNFASGKRAGRCRWPAGFLGVSPVSPALAFRRRSILTSLRHHWLSRPR
ncbi:hypothetical protein PR048_030538, partial [Dryococelus australis]